MIEPSSELILTLRVLAGSEPDPAVRQDLFESANALEQVLARTTFALAPSRDQMQGALFRAQSGVQDQLDKIAETTTAALDIARETHLLIQESSTRLGKLETDLSALDERQTAQYAESKADRADLRDQLSALQQRLEAPTLTPEQVLDYVAKIDTLWRERQRSQGDGG